MVPEAVTIEPATGLGTLPSRATKIPVGLTIEPLACTTDPGGIIPRIPVEMVPSIGVGAKAAAGMIVPEAVITDPAIGFLIVDAAATTTPVGLTIEPLACTTEPGGIEARRLVEIDPRVDVGAKAAPERMVPEAVTTEPATGSRTLPSPATTIPVGLIIEPFDCITDPGGIEARIPVEIEPRVIVDAKKPAGRIAPEAVTTDPATGFLIVDAGTTTTPVGLMIEPFACMMDPGGTDARRFVEIEPRGLIGAMFAPEIIVPEAVIIEPATASGTVSLGATTIPVGLTIEPSDCTTDPAGT